MPADCPTREEIVAYCIGALPDVQADADWTRIDQHLASCPRCQAIADAADKASDPLLNRLRKLDAYSPPTVDPCLAKLLGHAATSRPNEFHLAETASPEPLPATIGEFRILGKLGEGGMGAVYKAQHPRLNRVVAVKVMTAECTRKFSNSLARFDREIDALTLIQHVHVLRIYDRGTTRDKLPFFVAEYLEGKTLAELIRQHGPLTTADACELARQAALGLQEIHKKGCVHRDIKPGNLMLTAEGLKVLDMGLVGYGDSPHDAGDLTSGGHVIGTFKYMSPEQRTSPKKVGTRSDIYSLGMTLYQMLTGQLPSDEWPAENTPDPLSTQPKELQVMIQTMLARDPEKRFAHAAKVATELTKFSSGADLPRLLRSPGHKPGILTAEYLAASTVDAAPQPTMPGTQPRGRKPWLWAAAGLATLAAAILLYFAAGPVLNIETPKGTLKIEFPKGIPANAEILVNGTKVTLKRIDGTKGEIVLDAGDKDVTVQDGGQILRQEKVTILRSRVAIMTVEVTPRSTAVAQEGSKGSPGEADNGPVGEIANMSGFVGRPLSVRFSPSLKFAVTSERIAGFGGTNPLRLWDLQKRRGLSSWAGGGSHAVFSPDERFVASGLWVGGGSALQVVLTDPATGKLVGKLPLTDTNFASYDPSFTKDGKLFLAPGFNSGFIRVWRLPAGTQYREFKHGKSASTACFTTDDNFILSGGDDGAVRLWDIENDRQEKSYEGHDKAIKFVRALADGKGFVSVCLDWKVILWDLKSGKPIHKMDLSNVAGVFDDTQLAVAANGRRLLAGQKDGSISCWDVDTGTLVSKLEGHKKGAVTTVDITPDGRYALSGGEDLTLRYWRLPALPAAVGDLQKATEKK